VVSTKNKNKIRNLKQFRDMTAEQFEAHWETLQDEPTEDVQERIDKIMEEFSVNYDLRDMNANDKLALEELAKIFVLLEDLGRVERAALESGEISKLRSISSIKKEYLENASKIQIDLNITRKSRQTEVEALESYLPSILKKAKNFYERRLSYVYCPDCSMLVCNTLFTNWNDDNKLVLTCPRKTCNRKFEVTSEYLANHRNKNVEGVLNV
jgi:hypothetical protein